MKRILLALAATVGLGVTAARADHLDIGGSINFNAPGYYNPGYTAPSGYWRDENVNVWVPPHWEVRRNYWGQPMNVWAPGHYEVRTQRVWVNAYAGRAEHEWRENEWREHEWREHERREHEWREHDHDDRDGRR